MNLAAANRKAKNIRMLLARLAEEDMSRSDIQDALGMSGSGMRKYVSWLLEAGVITISRSEDVTYRHPKSHVYSIEFYSLCKDAAHIAAYLASLAEANGFAAPKPKAPAGEPNRHFYFASDDMGRAPARPKWKIPEPARCAGAFLWPRICMKHTPLLRTKPMARSSFKPSTPKEPKPAKGPRQRKCSICKEKYLPSMPLQTACGVECAIEAGRRKKVKLERRDDRLRKQGMKPRSRWLSEAQTAFNKYIRERDKDQPCICCGRTTTTVDGLGAHGWDCGHYRSVGSAPHMRYVEDNAHRQLVYCNRNQSGNAVNYRLGLIARIGLERVEALESDDTLRKYSIDDLKAIKENYVAKLRELKQISKNH